jgi:hypothetical protein
MRIPIRSFLLALLCANALTACGTDPKGRPIPLPAMPQIVDVPVLVRIPIGMTAPCPEPQRRAIATDVDLLETADAFKVAMRCNAAKLKAIEQVQARDTGG